MTTDLRSIKARLNKLQGQKNATNSLWKPPAGDSQIRIVPLSTNRNNPFMEVYVHYLGTKSYVSPRTFGEQDPIADYADSLRAGSNGDKEVWASAKPFTPKLRTYVPIVLRGKETEGVKFWSFGRTTYVSIMQIMDDPDYGDIVDVQNGHDLVINYTPQAQSNTNFAKTGVRAKPTKTPITTDATLLNKILNQQPVLRELFDVPSFDELKSVLESFLNPSTTNNPTFTARTTDTSFPSTDDDTDTGAVVEAAPTTSTKKIDTKAEFDKIFNS